MIPNAEVFTMAMTVNTAYEKRRSEHIVGIGYRDDIETAKHVILDAVKKVDRADSGAVLGVAPGTPEHASRPRSSNIGDQAQTVHRPFLPFDRGIGSRKQTLVHESIPCSPCVCLVTTTKLVD